MQNYFQKLLQGQLQCRLGFLDDEDQQHILTQCIWLNPSPDIVYENIFNGANEQKEVIYTERSSKNSSVRQPSQLTSSNIHLGSNQGPSTDCCIIIFAAEKSAVNIQNKIKKGIIS